MAIIQRAPVSEDNNDSRIVVSVALIIALAAIIGCLIWVKRRIRNTIPAATPLELRPSNGVQSQKGIKRCMLESIPVVTYRASLESDRQEELANGDKLTSARLGNDPYKNAAPAQAEVVGGDQPVRNLDLSIKHNASSIVKEASHPVEPNGLQQESKACSICTENFMEGRNVRILPCRHIYHRRCIDPWLLNFAGTCPLCRIALQDLIPMLSQTPRPPEPVVLTSETLPVSAAAASPSTRINSPRRLWR